MRTACAFALLLVFGAGCAPDPRAQNNAGNAQFERGRYDEAIRAYQMAQVLQPDAPEPYYNAASALAEAEDLAGAQAALLHAVETADESLLAQAYYNLGNVYFEQAQYLEALRAYQQVLLRQPDDADARHNLELTLMRLPTATPEPQEQQTEPEPEDNQPTPTPQPGAFDEASPTPPTPEQGPPDPAQDPETDPSDTFGGLPSTPIPDDEDPMTEVEVNSLLDGVQENQRTLTTFSEEGTTPAAPASKDW